MARKYFSLLERDPATGTWSPQFGDFDRNVVVEEGQSMRDSAMFVKGTKLKIIATGSKAADITAAVAALNNVTE